MNPSSQVLIFLDRFHGKLVLERVPTLIVEMVTSIFIMYN